MAITSLELDALKPKLKPYIVREKQHNKKDGTLAFKILPNGDIDGYFIYYVEGREKQKKIGRYGKAKNMMSLKDIRTKYNELSKKYQGGTDVKAHEIEEAAAQVRERQKLAAIERKKQMQGSFQQLVDLYTEHARLNLSEHYYNAVKGAFTLNLQGFDTTIKANEITTADIRSILRPIKARGALVMANRMRSYLSAAFEWARNSELCEEEDHGELAAFDVQFFIEVNPVIGVKKALKKEEPIDRFLTESEVYVFWQALNNSSMSVHRKNILKLMLALGCRIEALAGLRWDEVDFNERLVSIPPARSKNGRHWIIPINDIAYEILSNNPRLHNELLFPANNGIEPLRADGINQATNRLCKQKNINHFTPRDLRTTFKTLSGKAGLTKEIRDRLQNHALTDVSTKHYDRYDYLKEKQDAMLKWNNYLKNIIKGTS
ncbi:MAG: tyrosine-type recombinase/integrase [Bacteroidia bacterium]